jgi:hypothetical protein
MNWTKQPAIEGRHQGCLSAGVAENLFPMDAVIAVGFGSATVTRDGDQVYDGDEELERDNEITGQMAEDAAAADPDHDWRISLIGPLSERVYQRHGPGQWVLIAQGEGFA